MFRVMLHPRPAIFFIDCIFSCSCVCPIFMNFQDLRIQELQMELHAAAANGSQRSLTSSANAAVAFTSASAAQAAPERLSPQIPSVVASTSNSSSPAATGNLQKTASTQFKLQPPLQQSSSGSDSKVSPPIAGRAIIPPDQHYHPAYQLQQFRQPELSQNLPPSDADSRNSTLLQMQIAGMASPLSGHLYSEQPSADPKPQLGQYDVPSFNPSSSLQRSGPTLQEQLAEVQKQLQLLSSGPRIAAQPHVQFNSDTEWGTAAAADSTRDDLQFFA
jgi:hypothetical protein